MPEPDDGRERTDGWQLEANSAEAYERYLVPGMFAPWADELVSGAALRSGERALDVGCGTGIVARRAVPEVGSDGDVVGLDSNEGMLEVAKTASSAPRPAIEWRHGDATDLPFPSGAFDAVFCQQVLQFVSDPAAALREMRRVLAVDGRLALSLWRPIEFHLTYVALADALERHVGEEAATMMRSPFPAWDRPQMRDLVRDAGFQEVTITIGIDSVRYPSPEEFVRREAASSPLAGPLESIGRDVREALLSDVREGLRGYTDDRGVVCPMEVHTAVARG